MLVIVTFLVISCVTIASFLLREWTTSVSFQNNSSFNFSYARLLFGGTFYFLLFHSLVPVSFIGLNFFGWMRLLLASIKLLRVLSVLWHVTLFVGVSFIGLI